MGCLWICSSNGLWLLKHRYFEVVTNLPKNEPSSIAIQDNKIWVSVNGLYNIKNKNQLFHAQKIGISKLPSALALEKSGALWMATTTPKVALEKVVDNQYKKRYSLSNQGDAIFYAYSDSKKNLWFCQATIRPTYCRTS